MRIRVELYGIPRLRAGTNEIVVAVEAQPVTLGAVIRRLAQQYPGLAAECFDGDLLREGFVANIGGEQFISAPDSPLTGDRPLLIMSADAGG